MTSKLNKAGTAFLHKCDRCKKSIKVGDCFTCPEFLDLCASCFHSLFGGKQPVAVKPKQLTVKELIALLRKTDGDALVRVEGCDCMGDACGVSNVGTCVLIERLP